MTHPAPLFSLRGVCFAYPDAAEDSPSLNGVTVDIAAGEWVALVGSNGSGKSTFAKICNALLQPSQGACFVMGLDSSQEGNIREIRRNVSLVFQNPEDQIVASIVEEDVAFGPENLALPSEEIRERVDEALALVGLQEYRHRGSFSLSGGQKQRLALAGALAMRPKALLLDESTSMLDPEGRETFLACLRGLRSKGMTILQITHRMEEAVEADRVLVLQKGYLEWDGVPKDFFDETYLRWHFEEPPEIALYRALRKKGLLPASTPPQVDAMLASLCLS